MGGIPQSNYRLAVPIWTLNSEMKFTKEQKEGLRKSWTPIKEGACRHCKSKDVVYRLVEDDDCHEDYNYLCLDCTKTWWVEGIDY